MSLSYCSDTHSGPELAKADYSGLLVKSFECADSAQAGVLTT